jgi:hypothetical protein
LGFQVNEFQNISKVNDVFADRRLRAKLRLSRASGFALTAISKRPKLRSGGVISPGFPIGGSGYLQQMPAIEQAIRGSPGSDVQIRQRVSKTRPRGWLLAVHSPGRQELFLCPAQLETFECFE